MTGFIVCKYDYVFKWRNAWLSLENFLLSAF